MADRVQPSNSARRTDRPSRAEQLCEADPDEQVPSSNSARQTSQPGPTEQLYEAKGPQRELAHLWASPPRPPVARTIGAHPYLNDVEAR